MWWKILAIFISVLIIDTSAQGYNGCHDDTWFYNGHTHSCFKCFSPKGGLTWYQAKDECKNYGNEDKDIKGHLAKIDDETTNTFIKENVLPNGIIAWIGMYRVAPGQFKWDGFPDKVPTYYQFIQPVMGKFVIIRHDGWKLEYNSNKKYYICQHDAQIPRPRMTCPSPAIEKHPLPSPIECQFYFNHWSSVIWYNIENHMGPFFTCIDLQSCQGQIDGLTINYHDGSGPITVQLTGIATRKLGGTWMCAVKSPNSQILDTKSCFLHVYEPPSSLNCTQHLYTKFLQITCQTKKIYPKAICSWQYKNDGEQFKAVPTTTEFTNSKHDSYTEGNDGDTYFRSECQVKLTKDFKPGNMVVQISMYPSLTDIDPSNTPDLVQRAQQNVQIELPARPVFLLSDKNVASRSQFLWEDDDLRLTCQINSGKPSVIATLLSCDFAFTQSGSKEDAMEGTSYVLNTKARSDMNGKKCTCWGEHITGLNETSIVTFDIGSPAKVKMFTPNISGEVELGTQVSVSCEVEGKPTPQIKILKYPPKDKYNIFKNTDESNSIGFFIFTFKAKCADNGQYVCQTSNARDSNSRSDRHDLNIRVRCPPTMCDWEKSHVSTNPGGNSNITLCAFAYPVPDASKFELQRRDGSKQWSVLMEGKIEIGTHSDFMNSITVTLHDTKPSSHGDLRLMYYPEGDRSNPRELLISFDNPDGDDDGTPVIAIVVPIVIILVIVSIGLAAIYVWRKRRLNVSIQKKGRADQGDTSPSYVNTEYFDSTKTESPIPNRKQKEKDKKKKNKSTKMASSEGITDGDVYVNVNNGNTSKEYEVPPKPSRKGNELNYLDVVIEPKGQRPVLLDDSKQRSAPAKDRRSPLTVGGNEQTNEKGNTTDDDTVEYAGIDAVATTNMKAAQVKEDK